MNKFVLLVDDDRTIAALMVKTLERIGYAPIVCTSGQEAIDAFYKCPDAYAAVLTDYAMPEKTGLDVAMAVRALRKDIPIILMTGYCEDVDALRLEAAGIRTVLHKPFSVQALREALGGTCPQAA